MARKYPDSEFLRNSLMFSWYQAIVDSFPQIMKKFFKVVSFLCVSYIDFHFCYFSGSIGSVQCSLYCLELYVTINVLAMYKINLKPQRNDNRKKSRKNV